MINIGDTLIVTDRKRNDIHGFMLDEIVVVEEVRVVEEISAILCRSNERPEFSGVLLGSEVEVL